MKTSDDILRSVNSRLGKNQQWADPLLMRQDNPELPEWRKAVAQFMVSGKDVDAHAALLAMREHKIDLNEHRESALEELKRLNLTLDMHGLFDSWVKWATAHESFQLRAPQQSVWHKVREGCS